MKLCFLALDVAPLTLSQEKSSKIALYFWEREKFATTWCVTLCIWDQSIVRNWTSKL